MTVEIFKGVRRYGQAVLAIVRYPALLPDVIAMTALKYRREVPSARYQINPSTDRVEIFCTVTNVTSWTVDAGVPVGKIGWATAVP